MKFGEILKTLRVEHGLTQEAVAKILNVTATSVSNYESDYRTISHEHLLTLAKYYEISMDCFYGLEEINKWK